jgi:NADPH2:quinone reductase
VRPAPGAAFDPQAVNAAGSVFLTRPNLGHYTRTADEFSWRAGELINAIGDGSITITVGGHYPLAEAARAHTDLQGRRTVGSIVLVP